MERFHYRTLDELKERASELGVTIRWGTPEDVAYAVSVFCSDKMRYVTGSYLDVDGGFHIKRL